MSIMRPLILIFLISTVYGKPGFLDSVTPTPSAAPPISLYTPAPSVASLPSVESAAPVVNIGGSSKYTQAQTGLPLGGFNLGLGLTQPGLSYGYGQPGVGYGQPGLSYGQPGFGFQSGLGLVQPGLGFPSSGLSFNQPAYNYFNLGAGIGSSLGPVGSTIAPFVSSTVGPTIDSGIGPGIASTIAPPVISSTLAPEIGPSIGSTLAPPSKDSYEGGYGAPVVHKHVYVYVAPELPEEVVPTKPVVVPPPQTHYKIIFIKAPSPPKPTAPVIPPLPQNEEKTIVYVLAKKPDEGPEIKLQTPPPTQPAKPEVYFIRYKARKETLGKGVDVPEVEDRKPIDFDVRGGPPEDSEEGLGGIAYDLNKASLDGGSALSNAITGVSSDDDDAPEKSIQISSTPIPKYGLPSYEK